VLSKNKQKRKLKRKEKLDFRKTSKKLWKDLKLILKDGYPNGKGRAIKRKEKKEEEERLRVWPQ